MPPGSAISAGGKPVRKLLLVAVLGMVAGVVAWGGFNTVLEATNTLDFCISCHEMRDTVYAEYKASPHYQNPSGVRATCPDCHVPRDWAHKLARKIQASGELFHWAVGSIDTAEKFEAKRHTLAVREWDRMRGNNSRECRNCHSFDAMDFHRQSRKAAQAMRDAAEKGKTCIDCHKAIAHKMPDVTKVHRAQFAALTAAASKMPLQPGMVATTLEDRPLRLARTAEPVGTLTAGNPVRVLAVDGGFARIELTGWQREGSESTLYAREGKRILRAKLEEAGVAGLQSLRTLEDADSGQTWTEARLEAWVPAAGFLGEAQALWNYAERMYQDNCTLCHPRHPPQDYKANDWIGHMNAMKRMTPLSEQEAATLLIYLQGKAEDAGP